MPRQAATSVRDLRRLHAGEEPHGQRQDEGCEQFTKCNIRDPLWRIKDRIVASLAECSLHEISTDIPVPDSDVVPLTLRTR